MALLLCIKGRSQWFAEDVAKVNGDEILELPYYYDGLVNGDIPAVILMLPPETSTAAGRYSVTGYYDIWVSDAYDNNYDFFYEYGTLHVSPRALIVSAEDKNSVYGEVIPELTWVSEGFAEGEDESVLSSPVVILTTAGQGSDAGTYAITVGGAEATNYSLSFEAGTLTIDKATLAVTPENQTRPYAEDNPVLTFGYSGFVNGDDESVIDIKPHTSTVASKWTAPASMLLLPAEVKITTTTSNMIRPLLPL